MAVVNWRKAGKQAVYPRRHPCAPTFAYTPRDQKPTTARGKRRAAKNKK